MKYQWRCRFCGNVVEVERSIKDHKRSPNDNEAINNGCVHGWDRYFSKEGLPSVPFESLRRSGMFADDNGNFAPRNTG